MLVSPLPKTTPSLHTPLQYSLPARNEKGDQTPLEAPARFGKARELRLPGASQSERMEQGDSRALLLQKALEHRAPSCDPTLPL